MPRQMRPTWLALAVTLALGGCFGDAPPAETVPTTSGPAVRAYEALFPMETTQLSGGVVQRGEQANCVYFRSGLWIQAGDAELSWPSGPAAPQEFTLQLRAFVQGRYDVLAEARGPSPVTIGFADLPAPDHWNRTGQPGLEDYYFIAALPADDARANQPIEVRLAFSYEGPEEPTPGLSSCAGATGGPADGA